MVRCPRVAITELKAHSKHQSVQKFSLRAPRDSTELVEVLCVRLIFAYEQAVGVSIVTWVSAETLVNNPRASNDSVR